MHYLIFWIDYSIFSFSSFLLFISGLYFLGGRWAFPGGFSVEHRADLSWVFTGFLVFVCSVLLVLTFFSSPLGSLEGRQQYNLFSSCKDRPCGYFFDLGSVRFEGGVPVGEGLQRMGLQTCEKRYPERYGVKISSGSGICVLGNFEGGPITNELLPRLTECGRSQDGPDALVSVRADLELPVLSCNPFPAGAFPDKPAWLLLSFN